MANLNRLSGEDFGQLQNILSQLFDQNDLEQMAQIRLGRPLDHMANTEGSGIPVIVYQLIDYHNKNNKVDQLLAAALAERPDDPDLRAFQNRRRQTLAGGDPAGLVDTTNRALGVIVGEVGGRADDPVILTLRVFAGQLSTGNEAILRLKRYKALHDTLHNVQLKLPTILLAVARPRGDDISDALKEELGSYAEALRGLMVAARQQAAGLTGTDRERERDWIEELAQAGRLLGGGGDAGNDLLKRQLAAEQIRVLQSQQAPQINLQLVQIAGSMPLEAIADTLAALQAAFRQSGKVETARIAGEGREAVGMLAPQLSALVSQHKQWQLLDKDLAAAETLPGWRPEDRMPRWERFRDRLEVLCATYEPEQWSAKLTHGLNNWQDRAAADDEAGSNVAFVDFRNDCRTRFYEVDRDLHKLCGQLTEITAPLSRLQSLAKQ